MQKAPLLIFLVVLALLVAACSPSAPGGSSEPTAAATQAGEPTAYPPAGGEAPQAQPQVQQGAYPVLAGDENMAQATFFVETVELRSNPNNPKATDVFVTGSLPTPCHEIRAVVNPPDANGIVYVQIYSVADPDKVCTQVLEPYEGVATTIQDLPAGVYSVAVNSNPVGEVTFE